jgi:hypothetical protein
MSAGEIAKTPQSILPPRRHSSPGGSRTACKRNPRARWKPAASATSKAKATIEQNFITNLLVAIVDWTHSSTLNAIS